MGAQGGRTAFAIAGFAVGAYFGNPALGMAVGSLVGGLVFPEEGTNFEDTGSRLNDLTVTGSSYGAPIPIGYGVIGVSGNVIWSTDLVEHTRTNEIDSGGKGGAPSNTTTTYFYTVSFAVSFGVGPATDITRMWFNGKLVVDKTGASEVTVVDGGLEYVFYPGTETQLPDAAIEEDKGVGRTPAFRGQCYIVIKNLEVTAYGNRHPNIIAELAYDATENRTQTDLDLITVGEGGLFDSFQTTWLAADLDIGRGFMLDATGSPTGLRRYNTITFAEDGQKTDSDALDTFSDIDSVFGFVTLDGDLIVQVNNGTRNFFQPIVRIDGNSMEEVALYGALTNSGSAIDVPTFENMTNLLLYSLDGPVEAVIGFHAFNTGLTILIPKGSVPFFFVGRTNGTPPIPGLLTSGYQIRGSCRGAAGEGVGTAYFIMEPSGTPPYTGDIRLMRVTITVGAGSFGPEYHPIIDQVGSYSPSELTNGDSTELFDSGAVLVYDRTDGNVIFYVNTDNASFGHTYINKIDVGNGDILWTANPQDRGPSVWSYGGMSRIEGTMGFYFDNDEWHILNTSSGTFLEDSPGGGTYSTAPSASGQGFYDSRSQSWVGFTSAGMTRTFFNRATGADADLADIVTDLCVRSGLSADDLDVTDLVGTAVPGYVVSRQINARAAIQPLARLYAFDGVESDFKLKFKSRGTSSIRTITQAELVTIDENTGEYIKERRVQEVELPVEFSIIFRDRDNGYEPSTAYARRIAAPTPSQSAKNKIGFTIAGSYRIEAMKRACERLLFTTWNERTSIETQFSWKHIDLDPADPITVQLDDGTSYRVRLSEMGLGANLAIESTSIAEEDGQYVASSSGAYGGDGGPVQTIVQEFAAELLLLDAPLLRDRHEPPSRAYNVNYFFMGGLAEGQFKRALVYKSSDGIAFDEIGTVVNSMTWGTVSTVLPDPVAGLEWHTDNTTTVEIVVASGSANLESVTQLQMLNGANGMAILKANGEIEVIQFRTVSQIDNQRYQLSGLLRGRRGTDTMSYGHTAGERFILLIPDVEGGGGLFSLDLSEKDSQRTYRGVPTGRSFEQTPNDTLTSEHRSLKPYAVTHVTAEIDGSNNIDLAWVRRTRVGGIGWIDGTGTVPLSEDSEEYEIDIYDGPGGSIVRTVTGLTTPAYQYTAANQSTDGFSPPLSQLTVMIYQISAQVDRGFARELTLDVV